MVGQGKNRHVEDAWISAPFEILGHCRDPHGRAWGKQIRFRDADNRVHRIYGGTSEVMRSIIAKSMGL